MPWGGGGCARWGRAPRQAGLRPRGKPCSSGSYISTPLITHWGHIDPHPRSDVIVLTGDVNRGWGRAGWGQLGLTCERLQPGQAEAVGEDEELHGVQVGRGGEDAGVEEVEDGAQAGTVGAGQGDLQDRGCWV